jgi:hypothetical protein
MKDQYPAGNDLVSSADVDGTAVYDRNHNAVGTIDHLMIDKVSGKVAYAVMRFGGFLGFGEEHYPVPWNALTYDPEEGGFVTDITEEQLQSAPKRTENWAGDREWERRSYDYWRLPYYWM